MVPNVSIALTVSSILLALALGCGADDDTSVTDSGGVDVSDADATTPPALGERLGLFGFAPSFYELLLSNRDDAATDAFHFGAYRTGFTWPVPIAGDFDGDGFSSVGFFDPRARQFHLHDEVTDEERVIELGDVSGVPVVGDWDGDGDDELGVYDPVTGAAELEGDGGTRVVPGPPGLFALGADLDGDGVDTLLYYGASSFTVREPTEQTVALGPTNGYPFAGDFDGDGVDSVGVFDLSDDTFHLFDAFDNAAAEEVVRVAAANWTRAPIVGRWRATAPRTPDVGYPFDSVDPASVAIGASGLAATASALEAMPNLRSFLVLKAGGLVHEAYFHGNRGSIAHNIKSVSKSLLAAVLLTKMEDGTIPDSPLVALLPSELDDADPRRRAIELDHLMTMTSGLDWREDLILDWAATDDWVATAFSAAMPADPGTAFNYSTANTHIASAIVTQAAGMGTDLVARDALLGPLGIVAERWDRDPSGTPVGGAEVTMRPRDMARFGQLFLEDGRPDGTPIISAAIVDTVRTEWVPAAQIDGDLRYGAWWWLRAFGPADAYFAWGYGGQFIFVFPTLDAVVVVTSRSDVDGATSTAVSYAIFSALTDHLVPAL